MGQAGPVRTRQTGQNRGAQQLLNGPDMVREPQCHSWRAVALIGLTGHGNDLNLRLTPGAIFGCGGQKVDQQLFLRSSSSPVVIVKAPNDRISNDPYPRAFSRSSDVLIVVVKVPGAITSLPTIIQDLPDALLSDAEDLSQCRYRLTFLVTSADFRIACTFRGSAIGNRRLRENQAAI